jgi:hypothetical protein
MEYYSAITKEGHTGTIWMDLEERSQAQKATDCVILFM